MTEDLTKVVDPGWLAGGINEIVSLIEANRNAEFLDDLSNEDVARFMVNGEIKEVKCPPPDLMIEIATVESLVELLKDRNLAPDPRVFVSRRRGCVCAQLNAMAKPRDKAVLGLVESEQVVIIQSLCRSAIPFRENGSDIHRLAVRDAVKLLTYRLPCAGSEKMVQLLSRLEFKRLGSSHVGAESGRESIGHSLEMEAQNRDQHPLSFEVEFAIWQNAGLNDVRSAVDVGFYVDPVSQVVELIVRADDLERTTVYAYELLKQQLRERLEGKIPVLSGCP